MSYEYKPRRASKPWLVGAPEQIRAHVITRADSTNNASED